MSDERILQIQQISAHPGTVPGQGTQRAVEVCKYIDVTTCIGCKACEVACVEWNDHPFRETTFDNTYQTMPSTEWNYWNLIKFAEQERDGNMMWLMRKDQCMHCADPGCLRACPADGAIVQYENGIVDFQQENCIGCGYCISGCPFDIPKFNEGTKKVYKCTLCSDRVGEGLEPACIKASSTVWKWLAKPAGLFMAFLGVFAVFFHRIVAGPKVPQPEPLPVVTERPDEAEAKRSEKP